MAARGPRGTRAIAALLIASVVSAAATGSAVYLGAERELRAASDERLAALAAVRRDALAAYLSSVLEETRFWNKNRVMRGALLEFRAAWQELAAPETTLQRLYIDENPYPVGAKDNLEAADDGSAYSLVHARYHFWLRSFLVHRGIYDVFLFDPEGNLVYTSFKERDFATNLVNGPWSDTDLGRAFRTARDNPYPSFVAFLDFAPYAPSGGSPASFFASAVLDDAGAFLGVLAFQIAAERIDEILQVPAGSGETGETYAVGQDGFMRSNSRFSDEPTVLATRVETPSVERALAGETGLEAIRDYRGVPVRSAFAPLEFEGVTWAVIAEIQQSELLEPVLRLRTRGVLAAALGVPGSILLGLLALALLGRPAEP